MLCICTQCTNTYIKPYIYYLYQIYACVLYCYISSYCYYILYYFGLLGDFHLFDLVTHCERFYLFIIMRVFILFFLLLLNIIIFILIVVYILFYWYTGFLQILKYIQVVQMFSGS